MGEAIALPTLEEVALPTTRCVAQRDVDRGGRPAREEDREGVEGTKQEEERGHPLGPRTQCPHVGCQVPAVTLDLSPPHATSCHATAPKATAQLRRGRRGQRRREEATKTQTGRELPLSQGLVPWPQ